jgi:hypothetical protein
VAEAENQEPCLPSREISHSGIRHRRQKFSYDLSLVTAFIGVDLM